MVRSGRAVGWLLLGVVALSPVPVSAQQGRPSISMEVVPRSSWFGTDTPMRIGVELAAARTATAADLRVSVALHERARSRIGLRRMLDGRLGSPVETVTQRVGDLAPGTSTTVEIERAAGELEAFGGAPEGIYPIVVTVRESTGPALATVVTALSYLPEPPEKPLRILPVVSFAPRPLIAPDGTAVPDAAETIAALRRTLAQLPEGDPAPFAISVSPLLLDELAAAPEPIAAPATALSEALRDVARRAEVLAAPYAHAVLPHLPQIVRSSIDDQLSAGRVVIAAELGGPEPVIAPPALGLDAQTIEALAHAGVRATLAPAGSLGESNLTPTDAVTADGLLLLPADEDLASASRSAEDPLEVSRVVAETAMVYFESPGRVRSLAIPLDALAPQVGHVVTRIAAAPWSEPLQPSSVARMSATRALVQLPDVDPVPTSFRRVRRAALAAVRDYASFALPESPLLKDLRRAATATSGTAWWDGRWGAGATWSRRIVETVTGQLDAITASGATVTFTSRQGQVPITVRNDTRHPVRVAVEVSSPKLSFPGGTSRLVERLEPPGETITFDAIAESSGTFPVQVRVTSPSGDVVVAAEDFTVRSTAINVVALAVTLTAAVFLVGWYGRRLLRRRGSRAHQAA